jgi:competence protein ComEC
VRTIAAIPAGALLAGVAFGLCVPEPHFLLAYVLIASSVAGAMFGWALRHQVLLVASVALGFFSCGWLLSSVEWQRAWRPPLRIAFEHLARDEREGAAAQGRRMPEDDEAFAVVQGVLRADAARTDSGVSLSVMVDGRDRQDGQDGQDGVIGRAAPAAMPRGLPRGISDSSRQQAGSPTRQPRWGAGWGPGASAEKLDAKPAQTITGGILVTVVGALATDRIDEWRAGRRVRMPVNLRRPSRYLDPGVPDHERALARRGTTLVGTVKSGALVEVLAEGSWLDETMASARAFARRAIANGVGRWSRESAAIVTAIVIGDRAGLDAGVQRRLQEAGTYHVIAISGGNIAILAGLLLGVFRRAGLLGRTAMLSAIAALIAYARLVGGGASVDRATLMAVVYFGARAFDQRSPPLNSLALVSALLVASDPLSTADPAFLLTFGATLAILVVVPVVTAMTAETAEHAAKSRFSPTSAISAVVVVISRPLIAMLAASAAAEAMLFPIGAWLFSRVTFAGLGLNFLAIPLMGLAQVAGMLVVPLALLPSFIGPLTAATGWIAHVGAAGLVWSADLVRFVPALTHRVAPPPLAAIIIYYCALAGWWLIRPARDAHLRSAEKPTSFGEARRSAFGAKAARSIFARRTIAVVAVASALWMLVDPRTLIAARGDGRLHVTFLDVGQGDAIFVRFPRGSTMLVDAGGLAFSSSFDIGDRVVAPSIRDAGVRRLDFVALTHGDPDHIGGGAAILGEFRPREVWEGIPVPRSEPLTALRMQAQSRGARWANVHAGDRAVVDEVEVIARHPAVADWERQRVRNDDSIVLELRWRDVSVLLTGDIGREVERTLAASIPPARLRVMKVPHHGSLTSSATGFVNAMHPAIAVVSAGRGNHFGHPVPEVLERYRAIGAEIFRTDRDGAVSVETDGASLDVHTFTGRRLSLH